jgi:hypothetical protein
MSKRIRDIVEQHITKHGRVGKAQLCDAVEKSEKTLDRWMSQGIPKAHDAYKLALACGCSEKDALRLAREEVLSDVATETA